jgi:hypothetical protein
MKTSLSVLFKVVYNVYFRHRGIPSKFTLSATDWGLWARYQDGTVLRRVMELHNELGTSPEGFNAR